MQAHTFEKCSPRGRELFFVPERLYWLISVLAHVAIFLTLAIFVVVTTRAPGGVPRAGAATGGSSSMAYNVGGPDYFDDEPSGGASGGLVTLTPVGELSSSLPELGTTPSLALPQLPRAEVAGLPSVTGMSQGRANAQGGVGGQGQGSGTGTGPGVGSGNGTGRGGNGQGETTVFGVRGRGSRFVYVFDRSASMSGYEGRPLAGAKRELLASLRQLDSIHQFQVVFYNEKPLLMNLIPGQQPQLVFGDTQGKRLAEQFIAGVRADGGTRHLDALLQALQLRPDVIFFLTDADEPRLSDVELRKIYDRNRGTAINTIEFGSGSASGSYTFLQKLAEQNNGKHVYVDVTSLPVE
jgi:hypothetical protein